MQKSDFQEALRQARALLLGTDKKQEQKRQLGPLLVEIDRLLAEQDPAFARAAELTPPSEATPPLATELEALRREVERLRVSGEWDRDLLSAVLNESPHGIIVCNAQGELILHNRAAERIWAGSATSKNVEAWGQYRSFDSEGRPREARDWGMARCLSTGETVVAREVHIQRFDGTHGMLLAGCAPVRGHNGELRGAVSVFADITEFKRLERLKDRWVALAGHELRTPLQVLQARLSIASMTLAEGQAVELPNLLEVLQRQVGRLQLMVNDMLDVSRAQSGMLHVNLEPVLLAPLVTRAAELIVQSSPKHTLVLETEDVVALGDHARIEQVITNIVGNAIRYSPQGGRIVLRVKGQPEEVLVQVQDDGCGFEQGQAECLFEPFLQLTRETHRAGGLGLGLYLSRQLIEQMKGRIWASSQGPGQGATFSFALPRWDAIGEVRRESAQAGVR